MLLFIQLEGVFDHLKPKEMFLRVSLFYTLSYYCADWQLLVMHQQRQCLKTGNVGNTNLIKINYIFKTALQMFYEAENADNVNNTWCTHKCLLIRTLCRPPLAAHLAAGMKSVPGGEFGHCDITSGSGYRLMQSPAVRYSMIKCCKYLFLIIRNTFYFQICALNCPLW